MYKQSNYNFFFDDNNNTIVFNAYSGAILSLSKQEFYELESVLTKNNPDEKWVNFFRQQGIIIDENKDELSYILKSRTQNTVQTQYLYYRILPTTDCNARCFYCYEHGIKTCKMKHEKIDSIVNFIEGQIRDNTKQIGIQWYGGEPLMELKTIDVLTEKINELCLRKNLKVSYSMISNGILLNENMISHLAKDLNIKKIQITLDGHQDEYAIRKGYICDVDDPYTTIINNIILLANNNIRVDVRLNCDGNNYESMLNLIDDIKYRFTNKNIRVYPHPLYGALKTGNSTSSDPNLLTKEQFFNLIKKLSDAKLFHIPSLKMKRATCGACNENSFDILPDGTLLKCMVDENDVVGSVETGVEKNKNFKKWCTNVLPKECLDCKCLPLCQGGCRAGHLGYSNDKCFAYKELIEDLVLLLIKEKEIKN